jgi:hypothetical protein
VGRRVDDVIPAPAWTVLEARYTAALNGAVQSFEFAASSDGSVHWLRMAPIRDDGAVVGVMVLSQDTTGDGRRVTAVGRQRALATLRARRAR